jgi:hypothetical protein
MHLLRAEAERNIRNVVDSEIVYPPEGFQICPPFSEL